MQTQARNQPRDDYNDVRLLPWSRQYYLVRKHRLQSCYECDFHELKGIYRKIPF